MPLRTLSDLVFHIREISAGRPDLLAQLTGDRLERLSTSDFLRNVHCLAVALEGRGVKAGDRIALFAENRPEWPTVDFACHLLGAVTVPLDPRLEARTVAFVLRNSGARWVFYSDAPKRERLIAIQGSLTTPLQVVAFEAEGTVPDGMSITRLLGEGAEARGSVPIERFRGRVGAGDLATLVYAHDVDDDPRGVMLTHSNLVANLLAASERFPLDSQDIALSFLSLAYPYQRLVDYVCFYRGAAIRYLPAADQIWQALAAVQPTLLAAVPRFYAHAQARAMRGAGEKRAPQRTLFRRAMAVGARHGAARRRGFVGPVLALRRALADRLVLRALRRRFGGRLRLPLAGGEPLTAAVSAFFEALGMPIYHGYGAAAGAPLLTANAPGRLRHGSCGQPLSGIELRIAADGEILVRGAGVMSGYWQNPAATATAIDGDGWFHCGEKGRLDRDGYLFLGAPRRAERPPLDG